MKLIALNSGEVYKVDTSSAVNPTSAARLLPRTSSVLWMLRPGPELSLFNTFIHLIEGSLGILWLMSALNLTLTS